LGEKIRQQNPYITRGSGQCWLAIFRAFARVTNFYEERFPAVGLALHRAFVRRDSGDGIQLPETQRILQK
jgi:hypothetical protein